MKNIFERFLILIYFIRQRRLKFRSRESLNLWQQKKLRNHLKYVRARSQFYSRWIRDPWETTEVINKQIMMNNFDLLNTRGLKREHALSVAIQAERTRDFSPTIGAITIGMSSGTSGQRGLFCADFYERCMYAGTILAKALPKWGWIKKNRIAFFLRANSNLYESVKSSRMHFEFFDLLSDFDLHRNRLSDLQPTFLIAPPSVLRQIADSVEKGLLILSCLVRVYSVAEVLDPLDEIILERTLKIKIHQIYQCTEGFLAISCEQGNLHLNEDLVLFEKEWLDEQERKFVPILTDLSRRTQPIIRYRLNDILTEDPTPCRCGSLFTRLKMIEGRCDDLLYFRSVDGGRTVVYPDFIRNCILYASSDISEFRVIQNQDSQLLISLESNSRRSEIKTRVQKEIENLAKRLNCATPDIAFTDYIRPLAGEKLRRVIRNASADHPQ